MAGLSHGAISHAAISTASRAPIILVVVLRAFTLLLASPRTVQTSAGFDRTNVFLTPTRSTH